jgi:hypothetical protein
VAIVITLELIVNRAIITIINVASRNGKIPKST